MYYFVEVIIFSNEERILCMVHRLYTTKEKAVNNIDKVLQYTLNDDFLDDEEDINKIVNEAVKYFKDNEDFFSYETDTDHDFSIFIKIGKIKIEE